MGVWEVLGEGFVVEEVQIFAEVLQGVWYMSGEMYKVCEE